MLRPYFTSSVLWNSSDWIEVRQHFSLALRWLEVQKCVFFPGLNPKIWTETAGRFVANCCWAFCLRTALKTCLSRSFCDSWFLDVQAQRSRLHEVYSCDLTKTLWDEAEPDTIACNTGMTTFRDAAKWQLAIFMSDCMAFKRSSHCHLVPEARLEGYIQSRLTCLRDPLI